MEFLMAWSRRTTLVSSLTVLAAGLLLVILFNFGKPESGAGQKPESGAAQEGTRRTRAPLRNKELRLDDIPFNGERAFEHLKEICEIGPRISGTEGMRKQQELVTRHFEELGAKVIRQEFAIRHPETGQRTELANLIVEFHPDRKDRILLCAHYDTRPYPDQDPDPAKRRDPFIGANDGASGVALLMELGTHMADFESRYGVDFVLFDAEELIYDSDRDKYFIGSEHFARDYVANPPRHKYHYGILLDMVADKELQLYLERNSIGIASVRPLTLSIWSTAARLGVKEFIAQPGHLVIDDHLSLINIAGIPTCDIIDFDYPRPGRLNYWHTTRDVPENCSALSLAKVGWVVHEWLKELK
jgi:glutaminyl-peptide cyclotransferase